MLKLEKEQLQDNVFMEKLSSLNKITEMINNKQNEYGTGKKSSENK